MVCLGSDIFISAFFCCFCIILFLMAIKALIPFIMSNNNKMSKLLYILVIFVTVFSLPTIIIQGIIQPNTCVFMLNDNIIYALDSTYLVFYGFQLELLCVILLYRSYIIFKKTQVKISKRIINIFIVIFIFHPIFMIWSAFFFGINIYI